MNIKSYYENVWNKGEYFSEESIHSEYQRGYIKKEFPCVGKKILDAGCGTGRIGSLFVKDHEVWGVDFSIHAVTVAMKRGLKGVVSDIEDAIPFGDEIFDLVLLIEVIEHVFDPFSLLKELHRVLKPGGMLICSVPNSSILLNRLYFLLRGQFKDFTARDNIIEDGFPFTEHLHLFSPAILKKLLITHGFSIRNIDYWFPEVFISVPFNKVNWIAKVIRGLNLHRIIPGLLSVGVCVTAYKNR